MNRTLYFGPPLGFYEPGKFNDFALINVPQKLIEIESPSECNTSRQSGKGDPSYARPEDGIIYHYPHAGIGISYHLIREDRCMVNLMGTREREMNEIMEYVFEKDNEN